MVELILILSIVAAFAFGALCIGQLILLKNDMYGWYFMAIFLKGFIINLLIAGIAGGVSFFC